VLEERSKIPSGVLTTAAAFAKTGLIERLQVRLPHWARSHMSFETPLQPSHFTCYPFMSP
jgi:hypothetical protein